MSPLKIAIFGAPLGLDEIVEFCDIIDEIREKSPQYTAWADQRSIWEWFKRWQDERRRSFFHP